MHKEQLLYLANFLANGFFAIFSRRKKEIKNILVVKLDEIGDMVYALPVFDALKKSYPNACITVLCKPAAAKLLQNQASVDKIIHSYAPMDVDIWIELRGTFTTLWQSLLAFPAIRKDRGTVRFLNKFKGGQKHELETNLSVIKHLIRRDIDFKQAPKIYYNQEQTQAVQSFLNAQQIGKFYLMHTGASQASRRWPIEKFAKIAHYIQEAQNLDLILVGGPDEQNFIENNLHLFPTRTFSFAGKGSVLDLAAMAQKATFFVGNESGPIHIVSTANIPLIGLYGPGVKDVFYPLGENVHIIHHFLAKGHTKQTEANTTINLITVDEVKREIDKILNQ